MAYEPGNPNYMEGHSGQPQAGVDANGRLTLWPAMCVGTGSPQSNPFGGLSAGPFTRAASFGPLPTQGMGNLNSPSGIFSLAILGFGSWWLYKKLRKR